jgi:DNA primase
MYFVTRIFIELAAGLNRVGCLDYTRCCKPMADDFAQSVKQQADIVRIIGDYVRLDRAGAQNFRGLCPFHSEKTPSFNVHATQQFFHCFGCGQSGDVFTFVQKMESQSFPESVRTVAQKCGIPLPKREFSSPEEAKEARLRGKLLDIEEAACVWFEEQLKTPEAAAAREYLTGRGLAAEAIAKFRIGFAPDSFNALRDRFKGTFDEETLRASGLFSWKQQEDGSAGQLYARFRKRITFPISNESGRVIAFTARALESGDKAGPKYINSPETPLYTKGNVLFNLDKAKQTIRQYDFALLVEGQMDCISVWMQAAKNVIATSGTAFTEAQVRLLGRFTKQVIVNFDPDTAGANAAEKSIGMLTEEGFTVKVVALDGGLDPDRYIRERGAAAYLAAIKGAQRHPDYLIARARTLFPARNAEAKVKAINYLLPHIRRMPNRISRDEFAADAAQKLGIDSALMRQELKQAAATRRDSVQSSQARISEGMSEAEKFLLRALAAPAGDLAREMVRERLLTTPSLYDSLPAQAAIAAMLHASDPGTLLSTTEDAHVRGLLAAALLGIKQVVNEHLAAWTLMTLERNVLERREQELQRLVTDASRAGRMEEVSRLENDRRELIREKVAFDRSLDAAVEKLR